MDQRILEFIGDLRRAEVRISPSEALDALAASTEIGLGDRDTFKTALAATLVKEGLELDELTELLMRGEGAEMEMAIRSGGRNVGLERLMYFLQVGYFSRRIADNFDMAAIERDFAEIMRL